MIIITPLALALPSRADGGYQGGGQHNGDLLAEIEVNQAHLCQKTYHRLVQAGAIHIDGGANRKDEVRYILRDPNVVANAFHRHRQVAALELVESQKLAGVDAAENRHKTVFMKRRLEPIKTKIIKPNPQESTTE